MANREPQPSRSNFPIPPRLPNPSRRGGGTSSNEHPETSQATEPFDVIEWHPEYQTCQQYFVQHAQYDPSVQAIAAWLNIRLPFQRESVFPSSSQPTATASTPSPSQTLSPPTNTTTYLPSLVPYIRRLTSTAYDTPSILSLFFGPSYASGISPIHATERRNYLFAAKSSSWLTVKEAYDRAFSPSGEAGYGRGDDETVPFLASMADVREEEILGAEGGWSEWLCMQDWMVGNRAPGVAVGGVSQGVKKVAEGKGKGVGG